VTLVGIAAAAVSLVAAPGLPGVLGAILALLMLAIAVVDMRHFVIPDELSAAAFGLAFVALWADDRAAPLRVVLDDAAMAVVRAAALALVFLLLRELFRRVRGRQGLGLGDVKLACVAGAWLDWNTIPVCVEIAALGALAFHFVRLLRRGRGLRAAARLPFGPFLAPAIWLCWLLQAAWVGP
jgi:leader peptidase (prepilin peptidase)/N-methyltransferase